MKVHDSGHSHCPVCYSNKLPTLISTLNQPYYKPRRTPHSMWKWSKITWTNFNPERWKLSIKSRHMYALKIVLQMSTQWPVPFNQSGEMIRQEETIPHCHWYQFRRRSNPAEYQHVKEDPPFWWSIRFSPYSIILRTWKVITPPGERCMVHAIYQVLLCIHIFQTFILTTETELPFTANDSNIS